uniref:Uncharacterized protein n=1 Tax=Arundo donax TaxID=35708 RepID=A0A0A9C1D2_ARUDO
MMNRNSTRWALMKKIHGSSLLPVHARTAAASFQEIAQYDSKVTA